MPAQGATEREQRLGWVVSRDSGEIIEVVGYFCDNPSDPEREHPYWWCPTYGYSVPEASLHTNQLDAASEALRLAHIAEDQAKERVRRYDLLVRRLAQ